MKIIFFLINLCHAVNEVDVVFIVDSNIRQRYNTLTYLSLTQVKGLLLLMSRLYCNILQESIDIQNVHKLIFSIAERFDNTLLEGINKEKIIQLFFNSKIPEQMEPWAGISLDKCLFVDVKNFLTQLLSKDKIVFTPTMFFENSRWFLDYMKKNACKEFICLDPEKYQIAECELLKKKDILLTVWIRYKKYFPNKKYFEEHQLFEEYITLLDRCENKYLLGTRAEYGLLVDLLSNDFNPNEFVIAFETDEQTNEKIVKLSKMKDKSKKMNAWFNVFLNDYRFKIKSRRKQFENYLQLEKYMKSVNLLYLDLRSKEYFAEKMTKEQDIAQTLAFVLSLQLDKKKIYKACVLKFQIKLIKILKNPSVFEITGALEFMSNFFIDENGTKTLAKYNQVLLALECLNEKMISPCCDIDEKEQIKQLKLLIKHFDDDGYEE